MGKLTITHHKKGKCISFTYHDNHQFNIFDVEDNSEILEFFGRLDFALSKGWKIQIDTEEE